MPRRTPTAPPLPPSSSGPGSAVPGRRAPVPRTAAPAVQAVLLPPDIDARLKDIPEQKLVVGPLVAWMVGKGWTLDQMTFGRQEWFTPKTPHDATKRENRQSFEGFPVDVAVFEDAASHGDPQKLRILMECKQPTEEAGVSQLETYLGLEPHAKAGVWVNNADPSARCVFVFRTPQGLLRKAGVIADIPSPGSPIGPDAVRTVFADLVPPDPEVLNARFSRLLDTVVARDSRVTRREDQLDQLCNLVLLKLESDKRGKAQPDEEVPFVPKETAALTTAHIKHQFEDLVQVYPDVFIDERDRELRLADETIHRAVLDLYRLRFLDASSETVSTAFQVLRSAALKQGEGQYFTPQPVIEAAVRLMQVGWNDIVIDPACGTGGFLIECLRYMQASHPGQQAEIARWAQRHLVGIDKDAVGVKLTKAVMQILGDGSAHVVRGDSIRTHLHATEFPHLLSRDFGSNRFSLIFTNPPFGQNLTVAASDSRQAGLSIAQDPAGAWQDREIGILFLNRAWQLLRRGGRICIVLPETYFFSAGYDYIQTWMDGKFRPLAVVNVPMEAFQGFCRAKTNLYVFEKV